MFPGTAPIDPSSLQPASERACLVKEERKETKRKESKGSTSATARGQGEGGVASPTGEAERNAGWKEKEGRV